MTKPVQIEIRRAEARRAGGEGFHRPLALFTLACTKTPFTGRCGAVTGIERNLQEKRDRKGTET